MGVKLNLSNLNRKVVSEPAKPEPVKGIRITAKPNTEYNLDEIILNIRRDNSNASLLVQIDYTDLNNQQFIELMTKYVLDDAGIAYDNTNFKNAEIINQVENFPVKLEEMCKKYYAIFYKYIGDVAEGSISISTVLEKISLARSDYEQFLLGDSKANRGLSIEVGGDNKPSFIVEEGTTEPFEEGGDDFSMLTRMKKVESDIVEINNELDETVKKSQIATDFETATDDQIPTIDQVRKIAEESSKSGIMVASPYNEETGEIILDIEGNVSDVNYDEETGVLTIDYQ